MKKISSAILGVAILAASAGSAFSMEKWWTLKNADDNGNYFYLNAYHHANSGNVNVWDSAEFRDNFWVWEGDNLRLVGSTTHSLCLNAFAAGTSSNVDVYQCSGSDADQQWDWMPVTATTGLMKLQGSNLCLNAYDISQGSNVNMYPCDTSDADQIWKVGKYLPFPPD